MAPLTYVDEVSLIRAWANSVPGLAGGSNPGNPVRDGFHLSNRESPAGGIYGVVFLNDSGDDPSGALGQHNVSCSLWGPNLESAQRAATAYANACLALAAAPVTVSGVRLLYAANVSKVWSPDRGHARFVVTADFGTGT
jgi:hypothetical protein